MTEEKDLQENQVDDRITLIDEDGKEMDFDLVDVLEVEGRRYAVLMPVNLEDANGELEEDEAIIFRLDKNEDGEEIFSYIEDDKEWDFVVNTYNDMNFDEMYKSYDTRKIKRF